MAIWSRMQKLAAVTVGAVSGIGFYFYLNRRESSLVLNSWTTNTVVSPEAKWDYNWDHREPSSLVKPIKPNANETDENKYNELIEKKKPKFIRHIILIRHGQYNLGGAKDTDCNLTEIGRKQAVFSGQRLQLLQLPWDKMVRSTMTRAQETGAIISEYVGEKLPVENCSMIEEGAPIAPEPPVGHWRAEPSQFFKDGARIEAGFRKYFHRATPEQNKDTYEIIVCHANVIRYFVCRALQFPPEAWLRISLNHASLTWLSIQPTGRVILRQLGDSGHIPPEYVTSR